MQTLSAFRLVDAAVQKSIPVAILNIGPTRAEARGLPLLKVLRSLSRARAESRLRTGSGARI
eukprot:1070265-Rhodomonas_salina.3